MLIPKVIFENISLSIEKEVIHHFLLKNKWGWGKFVLQKHPGLKKIYAIENENAQYKFLDRYITNFRRRDRKTIKSNGEKYQKEWKEIEKGAFTALSKIIEIHWPKNRKQIRAMVSINPICPRFLNDWSFSIFYKFSGEKAKETILHECCHFLYFEKWREIFPKSDLKTFESPHLEWHLSEILAPIILNDGRIQRLLKQKATFYTEHKKIKIEDKTTPRYFTDLYNKVVKKDNFAKFLKESYRAIKKNKELFKI